MSGRALQRLVPFLGVVLSVVAIAVLLATVDVEKTIAAISAAEWQPVALATAMVVAQLLVVTARWGILLAPFAIGRPPGLGALLGPVLIGYLGNFVLPARLGEVIRSFVVSRRHGMPMSTVLGTVVLERIIDAWVLAVVALVTALAIGVPSWIVQIAAIASVAGAVLIVVLATSAAARLAAALGRARLESLRALGAVVDRFGRGAAVKGRPGAIALAVALSSLSWLIEGTVYWLSAIAIGLEVSLAAGFLVAAVTILATAIPSAPAYVGTFELTVTAVAAAFGVPAEEALAWALIAHAVTLLPLAVGGLVSLVRSGLRPGELLREAERAEHDDPMLGVPDQAVGDAP
jgi:glycosyltransferase 2 family protein